MRVVLAGYNVDSAVIDELKRNSPPREDVTPETLSASYARISRDPRPVDELRAAARAEVDRTRRSNRSIIFKMGHHSVAEHAVFNFDVVGVSRLAIEELERFRLLSFTEKSQRYITLGEDFVIPEEVEAGGPRGALRRDGQGPERPLPQALRPPQAVRLRQKRRRRGRTGEPRRPRRLGQGGRPLRRQPGHAGSARSDGQRAQPRAPHPAFRRQGSRRGPGTRHPALRAGQVGRPVHHPLHRAEPVRRGDVRRPRRRLGELAGRAGPGTGGRLEEASFCPKSPPTGIRARSRPSSIR